MKIELDTSLVTNAVADALKQLSAPIDADTAEELKTSIIENLKALAEATQPEADETEIAEETEDAAPVAEVASDIKPPKQKKQFVIMVSDPNGEIKSDLVGWVLQIPETVSIGDVKDRVHNAMYDFNASLTTKNGRKSKKAPVSTIGLGFENVPAKWFKSHDVFVKSKEAVFVTVTNNILPKTQSE